MHCCHCVELVARLLRPSGIEKRSFSGSLPYQRKPAERQVPPPSPFFFVLLFSLGDSKEKRYQRIFYYYICSLIFFLIYITLPLARWSCILEPAKGCNNFSVARNPPACVFAGGFRSGNLSAKYCCPLGIRLPAYLQADTGARKGYKGEGRLGTTATIGGEPVSPVALRRFAQIKNKNITN